MKKINLQKLLQYRKTLYLVLCFAVVSVFTLSIAYAAMSTVLEIHGNSEIVASSWDIHLENVKVKSGSVATNAPVISGNSTLAFDVELNTPGEFYEFTVDVVNEGSIDAMIDSVVKTPNLTEEQAKYIKYEITYENGLSITSSQSLKKGTSTPIKVRVEYRKDISTSDLLTTTTELSLKLTLVYIQSDGKGSEVKNNGVQIVKIVNGDYDTVGSEICIRKECFYVISSTEESVTMLAKRAVDIRNASGQYELSYGGEFLTNYSSDSQKGENYTDYKGSIVESHVNNYNNYLITQGVIPIEARLITKDELRMLGCTTWSCEKAPVWVTSSGNYWTNTSEDSNNVCVVYNISVVNYYDPVSYRAMVRPVITISKSDF